MADIFREVDEEIRRDNAAKLWAKYGRYLIGVAVGVVLATVAVVGWQEYSLRQRQAEGVRLVEALDLADQGAPDIAIERLTGLADDAGGGYAVLARLHEATLRGKHGDLPGAIAIYTRIADDGGAPQRYRDLATILLTINQVDNGDPPQLLKRLEPLTAIDSPWRFSALELSALLERRTGNDAKAREILKTLADDLAAPPALRARAAEMLAILGGAPGGS